jgi:nitrite reductase (NADH) small subunit/3-phenylpropionate/trans-cinnamate dioxygenase ferredoxin subunit
MADFFTVCKVGQIPRGEGRAFLVEQRPIAVFYVNGRYFALDDRCPHGGASLAEGSLEGEAVRCRIHKWRFSVRDGTYLDEVEPEFNARTYPVRVRGQHVQVQITPRPD